MKITSNKLKLLGAVSVALALTACGGSDVDSGEGLLTCDVPLVPDAAGSSCVDPVPIQCPAPTVPDALNESCIVGYNENLPDPVMFATDLQAVLYYNRGAFGASNDADDSSYEGYRLHTWNNDECDSYESGSLAPSWDNGLKHDGVDPTYGAYWILDLKEGYGECANFIIHIGTDDAGKALGSGDFKMPLFQDQPEGEPDFNRMNFTFHAEASIFEYPVDSLGKQPVKISGNAGHWIDLDTLAWNIDPALAPSVKLHYSTDAGIEADEDDVVSGTVVELVAVEQTDEQKANAPTTADWPAYAGDWDEAAAKAVLKGQAVLVGYNADDVAVAATGIQTAKVLDALYTSGDMDADEATLGLTYADGTITSALWAPTAQQVSLKVYDANKTESGSFAMTEDPMTGVWTYTGDAALDRQFYRFEVVVYHQDSQQIETLLVTDPYSVSLSTNGEYSQFVNLADEDLFPEGWDMHDAPVSGNYEDVVIYEGHIRDFSVSDETVSEENRGKYLAFTEANSNAVMHLQGLADAGVTHFHMLPANDIASINEDADKIVDITDTVADLCAVNKDAEVCDVEDGDAVLKDLLEGYNPYSNEAADLVNALRGYDSFNWGYDPKHFNVPDGIYASDPDGVARIKEMRSMIMALHDTGLRAVLDVVYNHTNSAGLYDNSVFDKVVPGYYHHRDPESGGIYQTTCCNNTALDSRMMDKFMVDSLAVWAEHYGFDGFRFDIMSQGYPEQMVAAREAIREIDPDTYFYGEGWVIDKRDPATQASQFNMAGTEISTFNDRLRDGIRNGYVFQNTDAVADEQDTIKFGMAGSLADYILKNKNGTDVAGSRHRQSMYAKDPADVINYISKHDDETLWDQLVFNLPHNFSLTERVRIQNVSQGIVMLSQGVPFLQLGGDFLRSKSLDRNTYDAGDWYNMVDYTMMDNNFNKGLPIEKEDSRTFDGLVAHAANPSAKPSGTEMMFASEVFKEFVQIRQSSPLFRLTTAEDIIARVGFHNIGKGQTKGLIVMSIDDGIGVDDIDMNVDAIVVVANMGMKDVSHTVTTAAGFELHAIQQGSVDSVVAGASFNAGEGEGTFNVPAQTVAVFVKPQNGEQGDGLRADATAGAPDVKPYGDAVPLVRGDMNGWGENLPMQYIGDGIYRILLTIDEAKSYGFKIATSDWSTIDLGGVDGDTEVLLAEDQPLSRSGPNMSITFAQTGTYFFDLNARNLDAPTLRVTDPDVFAGTDVFIRGDMNGWGEVDTLIHNGDGTYKAIIDITEAKTYGFKVASADWSTINLGAPAGDNVVSEGKEQILVQDSQDNFAMEFTQTGLHTFTIDTTGDEYIMTVFKTEMYEGVDLYLKGTISSWDAPDEYKMTYLGDSIYEISFAASAGTHEFKIADATWQVVNIGANYENNEASVGSPYRMQLEANPGNIFIEIPEDGTYVFTLQGPNRVNPHVTVSKMD